MRLSEFENEKALDLLADILEPSVEIMQDKELVELVRKGKNIKAVKIALKSHQKAVIEILSSLEGVKPEEYHGNVITMTVNLIDMFNDKDLLQVFSMQSQTISEDASGSATESTEESEQ